MPCRAVPTKSPVRWGTRDDLRNKDAMRMLDPLWPLGIHPILEGETYIISI
jgi:hypothetical protein